MVTIRIIGGFIISNKEISIDDILDIVNKEVKYCSKRRNKVGL
jgi:hypothetical protein